LAQEGQEREFVRAQEAQRKRDKSLGEIRARQIAIDKKLQGTRQQASLTSGLGRPSIPGVNTAVTQPIPSRYSGRLAPPPPPPAHAPGIFHGVNTLGRIAGPLGYLGMILDGAGQIANTQRPPSRLH
jgi:hypothetical protein